MSSETIKVGQIYIAGPSWQHEWIGHAFVVKKVESQRVIVTRLSDDRDGQADRYSFDSELINYTERIRTLLKKRASCTVSSLTPTHT